MTIPPLEVSPEWRTLDTTLLPPPGAGPLSLFLYADGGAPGGTTSEYRNISFGPLHVSRSAPLPEPSPPVARRLAPGWHELRNIGPTAGSLLEPLSPVGNCRAVPALGAVGVSGNSAQGPSGAEARLVGETTSACTAAQLRGFDPDISYRVTFGYRSIRGRPARICVWQLSLERCAPTPPLTPARAWTTYDTVVRAQPGAQGLALFLYADGGSGQTTETEYRDVQVAATASTTAVVAPAPESLPPAPRVGARAAGDRYAISVQGATAPFVLAMAESYSPGWHLSGLPAGATARHFRVDGYANAWLVTGRGDMLLVATYRPASVARWATIASALGFIALALTQARRGRRPVWRPTRPSWARRSRWRP